MFFGPCCDYAAALVSRQLHYWKLPILTSPPLSLSLSLHYWKLPMLTSLSLPPPLSLSLHY